MTYQEFLEEYKKGNIEVLVNKNKAGDFVLSEYASKHNKPAHRFWTYTGIILTLPVPIILLFINWVLAIPCFLFGLMISGAARKSAEQFVAQNMLEDEEFWNYILLHKGAVLRDKKGNEIESEWLEKMGKKYGGKPAER